MSWPWAPPAAPAQAAARQTDPARVCEVQNAMHPRAPPRAAELRTCAQGYRVRPLHMNGKFRTRGECKPPAQDITKQDLALRLRCASASAEARGIVHWRSGAWRSLIYLPAAVVWGMRRCEAPWRAEKLPWSRVRRQATGGIRRMHPSRPPAREVPQSAASLPPLCHTAAPSHLNRRVLRMPRRR